MAAVCWSAVSTECRPAVGLPVARRHFAKPSLLAFGRVWLTCWPRRHGVAITAGNTAEVRPNVIIHDDTVPDHVLRSWFKQPRGVTLRVAHTSRNTCSKNSPSVRSLCVGNTLLSSVP